MCGIAGCSLVLKFHFGVSKRGNRMKNMYLKAQVKQQKTLWCTVFIIPNLKLWDIRRREPGSIKLVESVCWYLLFTLTGTAWGSSVAPNLSGLWPREIKLSLCDPSSQVTASVWTRRTMKSSTQVISLSQILSFEGFLEAPKRWKHPVFHRNKSKIWKKAEKNQQCNRNSISLLLGTAFPHKNSIGIKKQVAKNPQNSYV